MRILIGRCEYSGGRVGGGGLVADDFTQLCGLRAETGRGEEISPSPRAVREVGDTIGDGLILELGFYWDLIAGSGFCGFGLCFSSATYSGWFGYTQQASDTGNGFSERVHTSKEGTHGTAWDISHTHTHTYTL